MNVQLLISTFIVTALINNYVLVRFLGLCPFFGVSKQRNAAMGMSRAVVFVITLTAIIAWPFRQYVLVPLRLEYLELIADIVLIAGLVQLSERFIRKSSPPLYRSLGIYLPLITTNCAVLAVPLLNTRLGYGYAQSVGAGVGSAVGFGLVLVMFTEIRNRIAFSRVPAALRARGGAPIAFITTGMLALAFIGFSGLAR